MFQWFAEQAFSSLWALIWHYGIMVGIIICAVLWVMFVPIGKRIALMVAICTIVGMVFAVVYTKLGADYVQAKWDATNRAEIAAAAKARSQAEASVPPVSGPHAVRLQHDHFDRDNARQSSNSSQGVSAHHVLKLFGHRQHSSASPGPQRYWQEAWSMEMMELSL